MRRLLLALAAAAALYGCAGGGSGGSAGIVPTASAAAPIDTLDWTLPTTRSDGSTLDPSEIAATEIMWGPSGGPYSDGSVMVPSPSTETTVANQHLLPRCYVALIEDTSGQFSVATPEVCTSVAATLSKPSPATGLRVA